MDPGNQILVLKCWFQHSLPRRAETQYINIHPLLANQLTSLLAHQFTSSLVYQLTTLLAHQFTSSLVYQLISLLAHQLTSSLVYQNRHAGLKQANCLNTLKLISFQTGYLIDLILKRMNKLLLNKKNSFSECVRLTRDYSIWKCVNNEERCVNNKEFCVFVTVQCKYSVCIIFWLHTHTCRGDSLQRPNFKLIWNLSQDHEIKLVSLDFYWETSVDQVLPPFTRAWNTITILVIFPF